MISAFTAVDYQTRTAVLQTGGGFLLTGFSNCVFPAAFFFGSYGRLRPGRENTLFF
jgi:hypothetical protein